MLQRSKGIESVGLTGTVDFYIRDGKGGVGCNGQTDHFITILGRGQGSYRLMRRISSGNEENLIEAEEVSCLARNCQVAVVNGVEAAPEETETCVTQVLSAGC
jgi:hypothetical protein